MKTVVLDSSLDSKIQTNSMKLMFAFYFNVTIFFKKRIGIVLDFILVFYEA